ncbi:MAG: DUF1934 domain-containing protein [Ruminococcaceae bacterium]|nr:DUF1934 domain-containing protein [Oscillospiraceae bacterium]
MNLKKTPAIITIKTERRGVHASLFDGILSAILGEDQPEEGELSPEAELMMGITAASDAKGGYFVKGEDTQSPESLEIISEGYVTDDGDSYTLCYEESQLTGLEGSLSCITFRHSDKSLVNMTRSGAVSTAMTFRPHCRTISSYQTPFMPFEVGIHCLTVDNRLPEEGVLVLDYIVEIRGGEAERCFMELSVKCR